VREAFRRRGHDAWSCDLKPSALPGPHIQGDVVEVLDQGWDLMIAHPECRYLANSGALRMYLGGRKEGGLDNERYLAMWKAAQFFRKLWNARIPRVCLENPVMHRLAREAIGSIPASQSIQPWQFGEDASKRTCLWLRGLPKLSPTKFLLKRQYANQTPSGQNKLGPSPERAAIRAVTYAGIAEAMAEQWGTEEFRLR
jgi:hypothetical protein